MPLTWSASGLEAARRQAAVSAETLEGVAKDARPWSTRPWPNVHEPEGQGASSSGDRSYAKRGSNIDDRLRPPPAAPSPPPPAGHRAPALWRRTDRPAPAHGPWRPAAERRCGPGHHHPGARRGPEGRHPGDRRASGLGRMRWRTSPGHREAYPAGDLVGSSTSRTPTPAPGCARRSPPTTGSPASSPMPACTSTTRRSRWPAPSRPAAGTFERDTRTGRRLRLPAGLHQPEKINELRGAGRQAGGRGARRRGRSPSSAAGPRKTWPAAGLAALPGRGQAPLLPLDSGAGRRRSRPGAAHRRGAGLQHRPGRAAHHPGRGAAPGSRPPSDASRCCAARPPRWSAAPAPPRSQLKAALQRSAAGAPRNPPPRRCTGTRRRPEVVGADPGRRAHRRWPNWTRQSAAARATWRGAAGCGEPSGSRAE